MRDKIYDILNYLIEELLNSGDEVVNQEDLINDLVEMGYEVEDIDKAFQLIFEKPEIIEDKNIETIADDKFLNRIFTVQEKMYLSKEHRGLIKRLLLMNIITIKETEEVVNKIIQNVYYNKNKNFNFWDLIQDVVEDENRIKYISNHFKEFSTKLSKDFKYIN
jgi:Smg protein